MKNSRFSVKKVKEKWKKMISKEHLKEVVKSVVVSKTPLLGSINDADEKIKMQNEIRNLSMELSNSKIYYKTTGDIEKILINDSNETLKKSWISIFLIMMTVNLLIN